MQVSCASFQVPCVLMVISTLPQPSPRQLSLAHGVRSHRGMEVNMPHKVLPNHVMLNLNSSGLCWTQLRTKVLELDGEDNILHPSIPVALILSQSQFDLRWDILNHRCFAFPNLQIPSKYHSLFINCTFHKVQVVLNSFQVMIDVGLELCPQETIINIANHRTPINACLENKNLKNNTKCLVCL